VISDHDKILISTQQTLKRSKITLEEFVLRLNRMKTDVHVST